MKTTMDDGPFHLFTKSSLSSADADRPVAKEHHGRKRLGAHAGCGCRSMVARGGAQAQSRAGQDKLQACGCPFGLEIDEGKEEQLCDSLLRLWACEARRPCNLRRPS